jgi:diaminohydroxyphosphoribosylaminopyrimidine deaminase/5-amino-6-(5-phosphoribosylamino)uracil reductase
MNNQRADSPLGDEDCLRLALELAASAKGQVSPNPLVGALVVKDGQVVGRGVHRYVEVKHAEAIAIEEAGPAVRGATLYTNLEPCSHHGRTPPCTDRIIQSGIARVVASMIDPNPRVSGHGVEALQRAGITVEIGWGEKDARRLNEKFIKYITTGRPFVHLKIAMSLDGRIATRRGESRWITSDASRLAGQRLRYEYDAILVGIGTVLADDPELSYRLDEPRHRPLVRVILDSKLRIPLESKLVQTAGDWPLWVFAASGDEEKAARLEQAGALVMTVPTTDGRVNLEAVLDELGRREITGVLVEGGAEVNAAFIQLGLADKLTFFLAPKIIGGRDSVPAIGGAGVDAVSDATWLTDLTICRQGEDVELTGYPKR